MKASPHPAGAKKRYRPKPHQAQTHHRDDAHGETAAGDDSRAVEKQPDAWDRRLHSDMKQRKRNQAAH
jgi:hypothetical protein